MSAATADNFFADHAKYLVAALLLHVVIVVLLTVTIERTRQPIAPAQLAIKATIVDNSAKRIKREKEQAEAERVARERAEAEKKHAEEVEAQRQEDKRAELKRTEEKRQQQLIADKKQKAEAERQAANKKAADDKKRVAEIKTKQAEKQKAEHDAREQAQREAALKQQVADEVGREQAKNSGVLDEYMAKVQQTIERNWNKPDSARAGIVCVVSIRQTAGGVVLDAKVQTCNGDDVVKRSVEDAVVRASPLPLPSDMRLFEAKISFRFRPEQ